VSTVSLDRKSGTMWPGSDEPVTIDLPAVARRSIESTLAVPEDQFTALAVVPGYERNTVLVLAIAVKALE
jgi:hypothetical protein